ncbi:dsRBD fold-containing protein [Catenulispora subtropica]
MQHVREWPIRLYFFEEDGQTQARLWLKASAGTIEVVGEALCEPDEFDVPEIGDEVAAGRALIALGEKLLRSGETDVEGLRGTSVHIDPGPAAPDRSR